MDLDFKEEKDKIETSCIYTTGATCWKCANHICFCSFDIEAYTDVFTYIRNGTDLLSDQKVTLQGSNCAKQKVESDQIPFFVGFEERADILL